MVNLYVFQLLHSSDTSVSLKSVDYEGSGVYKCEVSGEAPSFRTVSHSKQMLVVGKNSRNFPLFATIWFLAWPGAFANNCVIIIVVLIRLRPQ